MVLATVLTPLDAEESDERALSNKRLKTEDGKVQVLVAPVQEASGSLDLRAHSSLDDDEVCLIKLQCRTCRASPHWRAACLGGGTRSLTPSALVALQDDDPEAVEVYRPVFSRGPRTGASVPTVPWPSFSDTRGTRESTI